MFPQWLVLTFSAHSDQALLLETLGSTPSRWLVGVSKGTSAQLLCSTTHTLRDAGQGGGALVAWVSHLPQSRKLLRPSQHPPFAPRTQTRSPPKSFWRSGLDHNFHNWEDLKDHPILHLIPNTIVEQPSKKPPRLHLHNPSDRELTTFLDHSHIYKVLFYTELKCPLSLPHTGLRSHTAASQLLPSMPALQIFKGMSSAHSSLLCAKHP